MRASVGGLLRRRLCSAAQRAAERAPTESASSRRAGLALFGGAAVTTAGLCSWQLQRYQWKVDLIESRGAQLAEPIQQLRTLVPDLAGGTGSDIEFARVACVGEFDHAREALVGPRSAPPGAQTSAPPGAAAPSGWEVVTPLVLEGGGGTVLVNRGWVPRDAVGDVRRPAGAQRIVGVLRSGEQPNKYAVNEPAARRYVWMDLATMAAEGRSAPVLVVAVADGADDADAAGRRAPSSRPAQARSDAWPVARPTASFLDFYAQPSTHLTYAATWASLSVAAALMGLLRFR